MTRFWGGNDADEFVFDKALNASSNRDTIGDFNPAEDEIQLDNAIFTKLGAPKKLPAGFLKFGTKATDANDFILYNRANGTLSYDADANKTVAKVIVFAVLTGAPTIAAGLLGNFDVI